MTAPQFEDIEQLDVPGHEQIAQGETEDPDFFEMLKSGELEQLSEAELKEFEESNIWEGNPAQLAENLGVDQEDDRVQEIVKLAEQNKLDEAKAQKSKFMKWVRDHKKLSKAIFITSQLFRVMGSV